MNDDTPCARLAASLVRAAEPASALPDVLPCPPLDVLLALHQHVLRAMHADVAAAAHAVQAMWAVVQCYPDEPILHAQAHWSQGSALMGAARFAEALANYDQALDWYSQACRMSAPEESLRDVRGVQIMRVFCLAELGRYSEAQQAALLAESWLTQYPNPTAHLTLLLNRSLLALTMGDYATVLTLADHIIDVASLLGETRRVAKGWINRGLACTALGYVVQAKEALQQGVSLAVQEAESLTVARGLLSQAELLRVQGHLFDALSYLREAEFSFLQVPDEAAIVALETASLYKQLRQLPDARRAARRAAENFAHQQLPAYSAAAYLQAARVAIQQQQGVTALSFLQAARLQWERTDHPLLAAELQLEEARLALLPATAYPTGARRPALRASKNAAQQALAVYQAAGLPRETMAAQLLLADLEVQQGHTRQALARYQALLPQASLAEQMHIHGALSRLLPPATALAHARQAAALAVQQRRMLPVEELQARYSSATSSNHRQWVRCGLALDDLNEVMAALWDAKAGPLLDLRAARSESRPEAGPQLEQHKAELARWRNQEREHTQKLAEASNQNQAERQAYHSQQLRLATAAVSGCEERITELLRRQAAQLGEAAVPNLSAVLASFPPQTALLEYADLDGELICMLVAPLAPGAVFQLGKTDTLQQLLVRFDLVRHSQQVNHVPGQNRRRYEALLQQLVEVLLAPLLTALTSTQHLVLAPDGILHQVPWALLVYQQPALAHKHAQPPEQGLFVGV